MKISELEPGEFFEFTEPGYCFGRCMFIGIDDYGQVNFIHKTAGGNRFVHNSVFQSDPEVSVDDVQFTWEK